MTNARLNTALSLVTVAAAASAVLVSAAQAEVPTAAQEETIANFAEQLSLDTSASLNSKIANVELPARDQVMLAETKLHGGPARIVLVAPASSTPLILVMAEPQTALR